MSNPTLIVGFEDVMTYIKNQDQRIKELEKENKELKQKATAWNILMRNDWGMVSEIFDKGQCKMLIECGECEPVDFEDHYNYHHESSDDEE